LPATVDLCGCDRFLWATDFTHPDHTTNYIEEWEEFGNKISDPQRRRDVLGDNVEAKSFAARDFNPTLAL
jgi:predicted TIM-barrel fold metal-dependent hydrolase